MLAFSDKKPSRLGFFFPADTFVFSRRPQYNLFTDFL